MSDPILKTSKEWVMGHFPLTVLDPDGWDRSNFKYSFEDELITEEEFLKRLGRSTCAWKFNLNNL